MLLTALDSVFQQSYRPLEVIVVDDGSEVSVAPVLTQRYGGRVICVEHDVNRGAPAARNTGISHARGDYVAFLDDDDVWQASKLEKQEQLFRSSEAVLGLVYCGYSYVNQGVEYAIYHPPARGSVFDLLLKYNFVGSSSLPLISRRCLVEVGGFDEGFSSFQDWDMWLRVTQRYSVDYVDEILVKREAHGEQITGNLSKKISGREMIMEKYYRDYECHPQYLSHQYRALSDNCFLTGDREKAKKFNRLSVKTLPFSAISWINLIFNFMPDKLRKKIILERKMQKIGEVQFYR
jgi:glycosyltransferase involved in cell wall biosynthesis